MTPLPKKRLSRARQGRRRATIKITEASTSICTNCGEKMIPHRACPNCGMYRGRVALTPKSKTKVRRVKAEP